MKCDTLSSAVLIPGFRPNCKVKFKVFTCFTARDSSNVESSEWKKIQGLLRKFDHVTSLFELGLQNNNLHGMQNNNRQLKPPVQNDIIVPIDGCLNLETSNPRSDDIFYFSIIYIL